MSVKILIRQIPERIARPGVKTVVKDPKTPTPPRDYPIPFVRTDAFPRGTHAPAPGRYEPTAPVAAPVIITASPIDLYIGPQVNIQLAATGKGPFAWSANALPRGLSMDAAGAITGVLVGKPRLVAPSTLSVVDGTTSSAVLSGVYGTPPYTLQSSDLPAGASIVNNDAISVNGVAAGSYPIAITITDANGDSSSMNLTLKVTAPTYSTKVLADSPLAYWKLDEAAGAATAVDAAGNYPGAYSGATLGQAPIVSGGGTCAAFNGAAYVEAANALCPNGSMTFECWYRTAAPGSPFRMMDSRGTGGGGTEPGMQLSGHYNPSNPYWENLLVDDGAGDYVPSFPGGVTAPYVADGAPHHVAMTFDGTTGKMVLYQDGQQIYSETNANLIGKPMRGSRPFRLAQASNGGQGYSGDIGHAAVYDKALSAAQVLDHYTAGAGA